MALNIFLLCIGIGLLYLGSEWMVNGSASLAISFSIRPVIIGMTIVAFATSAPELLVSLIAAVKGSSGVSLGNILGSNVANIGLVLGTSALVKPLKADKQLARKEIPFMIGVSGLFWLLCIDGRLGRIDGAILFAGLILFLTLGLMKVRGKKTKNKAPTRARKKTIRHIFLILIGMLGLVAGANMMVNSAIFIARQLNLNEIFIGLSIVSIGTSLPELATSVVAGARGESDISIGNVVGSNIFNICMVMGTVGIFNPMSVDMSVLKFEFPAMLMLSMIFFIFTRTGLILTRLEGAFFILCFFSFIGISYWLN